MAVVPHDARALLTGARVLTMDPRRPSAEAVGLVTGRIAFVGSEAEVREALGEGPVEIRLDGGALLPGFIDAHHHYAMGPFDRTLPEIALAPGSSIADVLARLETALPSFEGEDWVRAQGYDPQHLRERRAPRAVELDQICPDRPLLLISYSFNEGCLNSRGLAEMGWRRGSPDPPRGRLKRDRLGRLTGEVLGGALFLAEARSRDSLLPSSEDAWLVQSGTHGLALLRRGITRVCDAAVPPAFDRLYERAESAELLPLTVHRMPVSARSLVEPRLDGVPTSGGPFISPVGPAKLLIDGAEQCAMCVTLRQVLRAAAGVARDALGGGGLAALRAASRAGAMKPGRDGRLHRGMLMWDAEGLRATVSRAAEREFQVAQHAVGNEAIGLALGAVEHSSRALHDLPGLPRVEHVVFADPLLARRFADTGAAAVVQPHWIEAFGDRFRLAPVPEPLRALPLRTLLDAGVPLVASSDFPSSGSYDPLAGIAAAVTRRTRDGMLMHESEAVGVEDMLRAYTLGAARALGVENECGSIEPGKRADLVALAEDPLDTDPDRLASIGVSGTWVGGRRVFG
jgi:predicted amidohydrolase YtcJ